LELLNKFYAEVKDELTQSITTESEFCFPQILRNYEGAKEMIKNNKVEINGKKLELPFDHSGLEDKIRDLISFFVIHLKGVENHNLCMAVVSAIFILEKDIRQNNRIRNRIFRPLCEN
ncbi:MAG: helix-turn-helix transcriptional regulator, partial [Muribaculaceae bacterium]|nr:helix-turn-helix transcriptional regulator [Muribaculaceae bacterium]